jgi:hypothetical protein
MLFSRWWKKKFLSSLFSIVFNNFEKQSMKRAFFSLSLTIYYLKTNLRERKRRAFAFCFGLECNFLFRSESRVTNWCKQWFIDFICQSFTSFFVSSLSLSLKEGCFASSHWPWKEDSRFVNKQTIQKKNSPTDILPKNQKSRLEDHCNFDGSICVLLLQLTRLSEFQNQSN